MHFIAIACNVYLWSWQGYIRQFRPSNSSLKKYSSLSTSFYPTGDKIGQKLILVKVRFLAHWNNLHRGRLPFLLSAFLSLLTRKIEKSFPKWILRAVTPIPLHINSLPSSWQDNSLLIELHEKMWNDWKIVNYLGHEFILRFARIHDWRDKIIARFYKIYIIVRGYSYQNENSGIGCIKINWR